MLELLLNYVHLGLNLVNLDNSIIKNFIRISEKEFFSHENILNSDNLDNLSGVMI